MRFNHIAILFYILITGMLFADQRPMLSPYASVSQTIGLTEVRVEYHRPGVKNRKIWGELVPFGKIWRAGANEATTISFSDDVKVNGQLLKAGTYSFFIMPEKDRWQIILNSEKKQWGAFRINPMKNVLSFFVFPEACPHQEWLEFSFSELTIYSANLMLKWEKKCISFLIEVDTNKKMESLNSDVIEKAWTQLEMSARTLLENNGNLEDALLIIDKSILVRECYINLQTKALILAELGRKKQAYDTALRAIEAGNIEKNSIYNPFKMGERNSAKISLYQLRKLMDQWK